MAEVKRLMSIREAADIIGVSEDTARAWAKRAVDPLPNITTASGKGTGKRVVRKVIVGELDGWLMRNSTGGQA